MDLTDSIAPKSDQLDAVDLLSGPRTFTIERVSEHNAEQPFNFHLAGFPRVWRPGKSMRRVIVAASGKTADNYIGKSLTLYCDSSVQFGGAAVGGTRISHMSGIDAPLKVPLLVKRGQSAVFTVQPLSGPVEKDHSHWVRGLAAALSIGELQAIWADATTAGVTKHSDVIAAKDARKIALT